MKLIFVISLTTYLAVKLAGACQCTNYGITLLERRDLFDVTVYGVVGDLHRGTDWDQTEFKIIRDFSKTPLGVKSLAILNAGTAGGLIEESACDVHFFKDDTLILFAQRNTSVTNGVRTGLCAWNFKPTPNEIQQLSLVTSIKPLPVENRFSQIMFKKSNYFLNGRRRLFLKNEICLLSDNN